MPQTSHKIKKGLLTALFAHHKPQEQVILKEKEETKVIPLVSKVKKITMEPMVPLAYEPFLGQYRRIGGYPADERW